MAYAQYVSCNRFYVFLQGYIGKIRSGISAFIPGAAGGGSKGEDGPTAAAMSRNQISGGKQMEGQMDRDCETTAAVSQVYWEIMYFIRQQQTWWKQDSFINYLLIRKYFEQRILLIQGFS